MSLPPRERRPPPVMSDPYSPEKMGERAADARQKAAKQIAEMILDEDVAGGRERLARSVRGVAEAAASGDMLVTRAALMELVASAAAWVVAIDLRPGNPW